MSLVLRSESEADTRAIGRRLASFLRPDDIVLVCGQLGAGKTAFVAGLAEGLAIDETLTSPSFVMARRYDGGFIPLVHADAYRLSSIGEFEDLGVFEEAAGSVLVIEWGDAVMSAVPPDHLLIEIQVADADLRVLRFLPHGEWVSRPLEEFG